MSQIEVTVAVGGEEDPMVYVSRVQTLMVNTDDSESLVLAASKGISSMLAEVRTEVLEQLSVLLEAAREESDG